jgi:hypothetical protein
LGRSWEATIYNDAAGGGHSADGSSEPNNDKPSELDKNKPSEPPHAYENGTLYVPPRKPNKPFIPDRGFDGPA